jgi:2-hydroxychromene-2-carboxylate isomerase
MASTVDFYFDFISPYTYLANTVLPRLAQKHGASIHYHPINLIEVMKKVGNRPMTIECRVKGEYATVDLQRWATRYQVSYAPTPYWPSIDFAELSRGALVALDEGRGADYVDAVYLAVHGNPVNLGQRSELIRTLNAAGFDGVRLLDRAKSADYATRLEENTSEAAQRGVFGSPTLFVGNEMFFGNDRLQFVAEALSSGAASQAGK